MKKLTPLSILVSMAIMSGSALADKPVNPTNPTLPERFESTFKTAMNDPNVMLYYGDIAYREGKHDDALRWMLEAARYEHAGAIKNAKFLIERNLGTLNNREGVIAFLEYYAEDQGDQKADMFARMYLADYFSGDGCVWAAPKEKLACETTINEQNAPLAATDMRRAYHYYEGAAQQGNARAAYTTGMMNILGLGVPRNVPLGISLLEPIAQDGNPHVQFILGSLMQQGYWMAKDEYAASSWFAKAAKSALPSAKLSYAQNLVRGVTSDDLNKESRIRAAVKEYKELLSGVLATPEQRAEAAYRTAMLFDAYDYLGNGHEAHSYLVKATAFAKTAANEYSVRARIQLGDNLAHTDLAGAVEQYKLALNILAKLPIHVQQRFVSVWQTIAYAYAQGQEGNLERDERRFAEYMNRQHQLAAQAPVPHVDTERFEGYSAFEMPR
jgi:TPR repeat protein